MLQILHTTPLFTFQGLTIKKVKGWEKKINNSDEKLEQAEKKIIHINKLRIKKSRKVKRTYG